MPDISALVGVPDYDDDEASFSLEDLMGLAPKVVDKATKSSDKKRGNKKKKKKAKNKSGPMNNSDNCMLLKQRAEPQQPQEEDLASLPSLIPVKFPLDNMIHKSNTEKPKRKKLRGRPPSSPPGRTVFSTTNGAIERGKPKRRKESSSSRLVGFNRSKSLDGSYNTIVTQLSFETPDDLKNRRRRASIGSYQVEFGNTFSPIAHAGALHKKLELKGGDSFSNVLEKVSKWKKVAKQDDRISMRSHRTIDGTLAANHDSMKSEKEGSGQTRWSGGSPVKKKIELSLSPRRSSLLLASDKDKEDLNDYLAQAFLRNLNRRRSIENKAAIYEEPSDC